MSNSVRDNNLRKRQIIIAHPDYILSGSLRTSQPLNRSVRPVLRLSAAGKGPSRYNSHNPQPLNDSFLLFSYLFFWPAQNTHIFMGFPRYL